MASYSTDAEVPAKWEVGDVMLDKYEVREVLGQGGFGTVYKVYHRSFDVELAVKCPLPQCFESENGPQNFIREATNWVQLGLHPHVVTCHYVRIIGGIPRVFAEYVAGGSLHDWIANRTLYEGGHEVALERILDIAIQFAWGLDYAHQRGLVHQDIKPQNVMMTPDGVAKVADFGLAKTRDLSIISQKVTVMGQTLAYSSPEQAVNQKVTRKTDIWSWGLSILQMFIGEVTWFVGLVAPTVLENYLQQGARADDAALFPPMPPSLADLLRHCFKEKPSERPKTMANIADELLAIFQQEMGYNYLHFRRPSEAVSDTHPDNLNNRAVSLMEFGEMQEAEELWEKAIQLYPQHIEAIANLEVTRWRQAKTTDDAVVARLEDLCKRFHDQWLPKYLLALVHLERADIDAATKHLDRARQQTPNNPDIQAALTLAHSGTLRHARLLKTLTGHTHSVTSVTFSPDGRYLLSGSDDKTLKVWEVESPRLLKTLTGHTHSVTSVAFSPDGRYLLSAGSESFFSKDNTLKVWEVDRARCLRTLRGHSKSVNSVAFSSDGRYLLSGSSDNTLKMWEVESGRCLRTLRGHTESVNSAVFSPDGRYLLSGSSDHTLKMWEVESGRYLRTLIGHTESVNSVVFSSDGHYLLSGSRDKTLKVWKVESARCERTLTGHSKSVNSVAFSPDGRFCLSGSGGIWGGDNTLKLWEVESGRCLRTLTGHRSVVTSVAFSPDGHYLLSGSKDKTLKVWEIESGGWNQQYRYSLARVWSHGASQKIKSENTPLPQGQQEQQGGYADMLWHQVRKRLGTQTTATFLPTWEPLYSVFPKTRLQAAWLMRTLTGHTSVVTSVAFSPDGHYLLSGSKDQTLKVWEVESGDCLRTLTGHTLNVNSVAFSADGRYLLSGSNDQTLKVWEVESGRCLRTLTGHRSVVTSVVFSPNGHYLLSGSSDQTLKMWEVESGRCLRTLTGHTESVNSVVFSPDGRHALSGSRDKTLKVWELESGRCLRTLTGHTDLVYSVAFSPDGRLALSGSGSIVHGSDYTLKVWEVESGRCLRTLRGHTESVNSVAFSPDGHYLLSGSWDNTLKVWEVESSRCLRTLTGHTFNVISVAFSPDARYALSGSYDGTIKMWALDWELEARELADWDEGARPYLENFLTRQTPFAGSLPQDRAPREEEIQFALTRQGKPTWTEEAFQRLMRELQGAGYGWLRPEGVKVRLLRMVRRR